jgi:acetyltransferase-like isoleucine patch superfamily enzyme
MIFNTLFKEFNAWLQTIIINIPSIIFGFKLRAYYWRSRIKSIQENVIFSRGTIFEAPELIVIGKEVAFGEKINIDATNSYGIYIGNNVSIAQGTYMRSANHNFNSTNVVIQLQGHHASEIEYNKDFFSIVIENDVWIGANAIILSGAHIGEGSVIGAGSLISRNIPPYSIVVGNPGRVIGNRKQNLEKMSNEI